MDSIVIGADVGGSHITAGLVDLKLGKIIDGSLKRAKVKSDDTAENIIHAWSSLLKEVANNNNEIKIGMALPGPYDYENGISYIKGLAKYESLYEKNTKELLSKALNISTSSIKMKNDAGCFLQGEIFAGVAKGTNRSIGITIGTGIGSAYAVDGIAEDAALWQKPMHNSIAEEYLSTRWFVKRYLELTGNTAKDVKHLCEMNDADVAKVFEEFADNLSLFLEWFINRDKPEVVVVGGNVAHASDFFLTNVVKKLEKKNIHVPLKKAVLGEDAMILGSAAVWNF